ncbi:MAG: hypothetical protein H6Q19_874 [Bacteroidetes bacterium]|nr:hypothetical protein [Bacteroidota bacterium]
MKNKLIYSMMIAAATFLGACNQTEFDAIPVGQLMGVKLDSTYTIAQLKSEFLKSGSLFSADTIKSDKDVIIKGIVTSSDVEGNVYKYLVIQEEGPNAQAMKISIDAGSLSGIYPLGQRVAVKCNGMMIGNYAQAPQIGIYYYNTEKGRVEPGRMPKYLSDKNIFAYGMPVPQVIKADTMTIAQIKAAGPALYNKLVCIKNAFFTGRGAYSGKPTAITDAEMIFAPSTNGVGYPQSREIQDGTGSIFVSTSEYSKFANKHIPVSNLKGNITALVGFYNDKDATLSASKIYHQLTLRSISDLGKGFEAYHAAN